MAPEQLLGTHFTGFTSATVRASSDAETRLVYFLERGVRVTAARQRLRLLGATLDMLQHELLAAFSIE